MRILIIDQCSGSKRIDSRDDTSLDGGNSLPARKMYTGRQQRYITQAVEKLRAEGDEVDRFFISAKYGLISGEERIQPYDKTFKQMSTEEIEQFSSETGIQEDLLEIVDENEYDLIFLALGDDYYSAVDLDGFLSKVNESIAVLFNRGDMDVENTVSIPAKTEQAKEHNTIVVGLKGVYLQNFADHRAKGKRVTGTDDVVRYCTTQSGRQEKLG